MKLTHSRVSEWRRGVYVPSQFILSQMLYRTLPWMLIQAGIEASAKQLNTLKGLIWILEEKDGQVFVDLL